MRTAMKLTALAATLVLGVGLSACGSSKKSSATVTPSKGKTGGTLNVISAEAWEHLDPGQSYFQIDYLVEYAVHRPLYQYMPDQLQSYSPDLAASLPVVSADKKTITIHIKPGIKFSPPVNREVTSADVKYAIERGFNKSVANGYASAYFGDIIGAAAAAKAADGRPIPGIETPDKDTLVFKLVKPSAELITAGALSLPLTAPVPKEYAAKFDKVTPTAYDSKPTQEAFTGPYMIQTYQPGKQLILVRNPNWSKSTDFRPAYADRIVWNAGADPNVAGREVLNGSNIIMADTVPATLVKQFVQTAPSQITFPPLGNRYVAFNTAMPPFNNVNLRKAVTAAMDRKAMQLTRGGPVAGDIATHFMGPTSASFNAAGGFAGPGYDFLASPNGNMTVATKYMKLAGFPSGKYHGSPVLMVGDNSDPASKSAQVALAAFQKLGFTVNFRSVPHETMYSKFCNVPKANVQICPNVGWLPDFADGYAWLFVPFNGSAIVPVNNSNWPQLNDPAVNAAMDQANLLSGQARINAWGQVDKMITALAPAVPWFWDKLPTIEGKGVNGVIDKWNADWDLSFTSLK